MCLKSEITYDVVRIIITFVVVYLLLAVCAITSTSLMYFLDIKEAMLKWLPIYLVSIAPLTAAAVTAWLWIMENHIDE